MKLPRQHCFHNPIFLFQEVVIVKKLYLISIVVRLEEKNKIPLIRACFSLGFPLIKKENVKRAVNTNPKTLTGSNIS